MESHEILPAIPRQKVKCYGKEHSVLGAYGKSVFVSRVNDIGEEVTYFANPEDCEPVLEEPRPLRVGDKVVVIEGTGCDCNGAGYPCSHGDMLRYCIVTGIFGDSISVSGGDGKEDIDEKYIRHATPEELAKYS